MERLDVASNALSLNTALIGSLTQRIRMLLNVEDDFRLEGVRLQSAVRPAEFVLSAQLNLQFSTAIDRLYGFTLRVLFSKYLPCTRNILEVIKKFAMVTTARIMKLRQEVT